MEDLVFHKKSNAPGLPTRMIDKVGRELRGVLDRSSNREANMVMESLACHTIESRMTRVDNVMALSSHPEPTIVYHSDCAPFPCLAYIDVDHKYASNVEAAARARIVIMNKAE